MPESLATDPATASAAGLVDALHRRAVSAVELTDAAIARIEALDARLNAVVVRDFDRARDAARAADAALARGERRPLLGVPMTVKEAHGVAGLPTTWGLPAFRHAIAAHDSLGVRRLKDAGAVILGKTNVPTFLADWQSANPIHGRTSNPWDPGRTPGGSSGGGAAAVAAGYVPLEFGSDLAGSIRVPAAFCGVCGHKPSHGLVPMDGVAPPGAAGGAGVPIVVLGPLARRAGDLELALRVLARIDDAAQGGSAALARARHARLADYRVLILDRHPDAALDAEIRGALHALADRLAAAGATVAFDHDALPDLREIGECFAGMVRIIASPDGPPPARSAAAAEWSALRERQRRIGRQWADFFASFDAVLAPAFGTVAFAHDERPEMHERVLTIDGRPTPYVAQGAWSGIASLGHLPATVAPIGRTAAGLPIGVQIIGPHREDRTTIGLAALIERELGGFAPPP